VLPYFRKAENQQRGADEYHGTGGPLSVSDPPEPHPLADAYLAAAEECGYRRNPDFNGATQEGFGYNQWTIRKGLRSSAATGYPASGPAAEQPASDYAGPRYTHRIHRQACDGRGVPALWDPSFCDGPRRGPGSWRLLQLPAAAATLGSRAGIVVAAPGHRRRRRHAWRGDESTGSLCRAPWCTSAPCPR
jgi:choline dehydrogenase-like flavoprotein